MWLLGSLLHLSFWSISGLALVQASPAWVPVAMVPWLVRAFWLVLALNLVLFVSLARELREARELLFPHLWKTLLFGIFHFIPTRTRCRELVAAEQYMHPGSRRVVPWQVRAAQLAMQCLFGLLALVKRARATHTTGIAATGIAVIEPSPDFPDHDFFARGRTYPIVLRHANLKHADDRCRDIRGAALRFGGLEDNGLFDMMMNTGETSAFWDIPCFLRFVRLSPGGAAGLEQYLNEYPLALPASLGALYWGPSSYANLAYFSQLVFRFVGEDGILRYVRYRLIPAEQPPEEVTHQESPPWEDAIRPDDEREPDYLQREYQERLTQGKVRYKFQAQLREPSDDPAICHSGYRWENIPWLDVATLTIDALLSDEDTRSLACNIGNHPKSLGLLPSTNWREYNALAHLRVPVYKGSAFARFFRKPFQARPRWDYDLQSPFPRARKRHDVPPMGFPAGRNRAYYTLESLLLVLKYQFNRQLGGLGLVSAKQMQRLHPVNKTIHKEREAPGSSRCDQSFGEQILNGFYPPPLFRKEDDPDVYLVHFCWDRERFDGDIGLTNSQVSLRLEGDRLVPSEIAIQFRRQGEWGADPILEPDEVIHPGEGQRWELAKQLVRTSLCLEGQALGHFLECHINMEQYAVAAFRRLQGHPLASLLFPHLKGVVEINRQGEGVIFGDSGILCTNSALTGASANGLFVRHLGGLNWAGWRPRKPLCATDHFGHIADLFWRIVWDYVASYIDARREDISRQWSAVYAFSMDLLYHSAPHASKIVLPNASRLGMPEETPALVSLGAVQHAVSPVTLSASAPQAEDWANLTRVCAYIIFHTTLYHTWTNDNMHDTLGEVAHMNFGVSDAALRAVWARGEMRELYPPPIPAAYQLYLVNILVQVRHGLLMANECNDVSTSLIESLESHRAEFAKWGMNIDTIRSCINI